MRNVITGIALLSTKSEVGPVCSALASFLSAWIWRQTSSASVLPGCGSASGCEAVTRGRWARIGPLPVSMVGAIFYTFATLVSALKGCGFQNPIVCALAAISATVIMFVAGWFIFVQLAVIRKLCIYCSAVHAFAILSAVCMFSNHQIWVSAMTAVHLAVSFCGVSILITVQILMPPPSFAVSPPTAITVFTQNQSPTDSADEGGLPNNRLLLNHRISIDLETWPTLGNANAPHIVAWLFSFNCEECHRLHPMLREAVELYDGDLAVIAIPIPPYLADKSGESPLRGDEPALRFARLTLAVWSADPESYDAWDRFMAESSKPRSFDSALEKAKDLADLESFDINNGNADTERKLAEAINLSKQAGDPSLPTLILPKVLVSGRVPNLATLIKILDEHALNVNSGRLETNAKN